jgi:hypothetical protein
MPWNLASKVSRSRGTAAGVRSMAGPDVAPGLSDSGRDARGTHRTGNIPSDWNIEIGVPTKTCMLPRTGPPVGQNVDVQSGPAACPLSPNGRRRPEGHQRPILSPGALPTTRDQLPALLEASMAQHGHRAIGAVEERIHLDPRAHEDQHPILANGAAGSRAGARCRDHTRGTRRRREEGSGR